jgi:DNA-binding NarL/FixJ family response regulator
MILKSINVGIVDSHALFRKSLKSFLSEQKNINVTLQAPNVFELLARLKNTSVDVLLLDLFIPEINSTQLVSIIHNEYPQIKILVLSVCIDINIISELLDLGIQGYISKADEPEELIQAIYAIAENKIYRNSLFTEALYWNKQNNNNNKTLKNGAPAALSDREIKLLQLIWEEKSTREIANELYLAKRTIEKIRQDLKERLGVKSTIGLLKYALNEKVISTNNRNIIQNRVHGKSLTAL